MDDPEPTKTQSAGAPRILLVDDEPYVVAALLRHLEKEPYEFTWFTDPRKVMDAFLNEHFALIISDNLMPAITGLELLDQIKTSYPETRRILLTGHTDHDQAIQAFNDGVIHRFIDKPWRKGELLAALKKELDIYQQQDKSRSERIELERTVTKRTSQLQEAAQVIKQAHTQLALYKDSAQAARLRLPPKIRRLSFLVVEEHSGVRNVITNSLKKAGVSNCQSVASGQDALNWIQSSPAVDVILSEWNMTKMDGLSLFREVRQGKTLTTNAIFMLVTTREDKNSIETALQAGVDGYVIKPFHLNSLLGQLERRLDRKPKDDLKEIIGELRPLSIVVANANLPGRVEIKDMLVSSGIKNVVMADSGQRVLRLIQSMRVDVLIYDCNILDPYWLHLRESLDELESPVNKPGLVVTSGSPLKREFEDVNSAGLTTFLPGEVERRVLFQVILKAYRQEVA